jgi:S-DNA-T family DNA segregation ATPase FtsK/SpoIIIE
MGLGTDHVPAVHDWNPGSTLLVVGPSRSGRSSFLNSVAGQFHDTPPLRCRSTTAGELDALFTEAEPGTTVLIDDADSLPAPVIQRLGALWQPGTGTSGVGSAGVVGKELRLIVTARLSDGLPSLFPPLMSWRHTADTLLLRPRKAFDGDLFGASLSGMPLGGSPGRGYWIHRGMAELVQTPQWDG